MKNKKVVIVLVGVLVLLMVSASVLYKQFSAERMPDQLATQSPTIQGTDGEEETKPLTPAIDFKVYDLGGKAVKLSDYIGKPIVLNFWASWCGPCRSEMPGFNEAYERLGDEVQFLMVNMTDGSRETVKSASSYVYKHGFSFPVFYDTDSDAMKAYGVYSLPTSYFIDRQGYIVARANGSISPNVLQQGIDMIHP